MPKGYHQISENCCWKCVYLKIHSGIKTSCVLDSNQEGVEPDGMCDEFSTEHPEKKKF